MSDLVPIKDLFDVIYGVNLELVNLEICDKNTFDSIRFISRTEKNNGLSAYVKKVEEYIPNPSHTISVAVSGSVLSSFYQDEQYFSGRDIYYLQPKEEMSKEDMLFYAFCLTKNKYRYNYGRGANRTLKDILVPSKIPQTLKSTIAKSNFKISNESFLTQKKSLAIDNFSDFDLHRLFSIAGSKTTSILDLDQYGLGKYPYVTTQATNNGVEGFYNFYTEKGGVLTIDSAVLGYCSYQPLPFSASDHVEILTPKFNMNIYIALFLVTIINKEQYRYNYGRKASQKRLNGATIKLPATKEGQPDFELMENFIKSLPYSKILVQDIEQSSQILIPKIASKINESNETHTIQPKENEKMTNNVASVVIKSLKHSI